MQFESLFNEAFDTFKVFKSLSVDIATRVMPGTPKNIWQIFNHLILWQENQLLLLEGHTPEKGISEMETWIKPEVPNGQRDINGAVFIFEEQIRKVKAIASGLSFNEVNFENKFKILLEMATHLSFHLGEIILLRRQCGNYPMPEEMQDFLEED